MDVNCKAAEGGKTLGDIVFTTWQTSWAKRINDFVGKADHKVPEVPSGKFLELLSIQRGKQKIRNTWEMFLSWHVAAAMKQIPQITRKKRSRPTAATNIEPQEGKSDEADLDLTSIATANNEKPDADDVKAAKKLKKDKKAAIKAGAKVVETSKRKSVGLDSSGVGGVFSVFDGKFAEAKSESEKKMNEAFLTAEKQYNRYEVVSSLNGVREELRESNKNIGGLVNMLGNFLMRMQPAAPMPVQQNFHQTHSPPFQMQPQFLTSPFRALENFPNNPNQT